TWCIETAVSRRCSSVSHTPTSSRCCVWAATEEKWFFEIRPHPTMATLTLRSLMARGALRPNVLVEIEMDIQNWWRSPLLRTGVNSDTACSGKNGVDCAPAHPSGQTAGNENDISCPKQDIRALGFQDLSQIQRDLLPLLLVRADKTSL